jgi:hypothetical protein
MNSSFAQFIDGLEKLDDGTPIRVVPMENKGYSYGQWTKIIQQEVNNFDHHIFMEDDFAVATDNFDEMLVNKFESKKNCGYMCGLVADPDGRYRIKCPNRHAAISNGISSKKVLQKILENRKGNMPYVDCGYRSQVMWSNSFISGGFDIHDWLDDYRSIFFSNNQRPLRIYTEDFNKMGTDIFNPLQIANDPERFNYTLITKNMTHRPMVDIAF